MAEPTCAQGAPAHRPVSNRRWYGAAFVALVAAYVAFTILTLVGSPVLSLDGYVFGLHIGGHNPQWAPLVNVLVIAGQRGPSTLVALPWFAWRAWRQRSLRPLVMLVTALLLLNLSVGAVKVLTGRVGPRHTVLPADFFAGGNIYPSGHVSNAVVLFGLLALLAVRHRRAMVAVAVFVPVMVGACTIYLRTHWVSDIVGGWLAGGLVLMMLPWLMPGAERCAAAAVRAVARWLHRPGLAALAHDLPGANLPVPVAAEGATARPVPATAVARATPEAQPAARGSVRSRSGAVATGGARVGLARSVRQTAQGLGRAAARREDAAVGGNARR